MYRENSTGSALKSVCNAEPRRQPARAFEHGAMTFPRGSSRYDPRKELEPRRVAEGRRGRGHPSSASWPLTRPLCHVRQLNRTPRPIEPILRSVAFHAERFDRGNTLLPPSRTGGIRPARKVRMLGSVVRLPRLRGGGRGVRTVSAHPPSLQRYNKKRPGSLSYVLRASFRPARALSSPAAKSEPSDSRRIRRDP